MLVMTQGRPGVRSRDAAHFLLMTSESLFFSWPGLIHPEPSALIMHPTNILPWQRRRREPHYAKLVFGSQDSPDSLCLPSLFLASQTRGGQGDLQVGHESREWSLKAP